MACCCGPNYPNCDCVPGPVQLDVNVTIPRALFVTGDTDRCLCSNDVTIQYSRVRLPSFDAVKSSFFYDFNGPETEARLQYGCRPVPGQVNTFGQDGFFTLGLFTKWLGHPVGTRPQCDFFGSTPCEAGRASDGSRGLVGNSSAAAIAATPCDSQPPYTYCCPNGSRTFDYITQAPGNPPGAPFVIGTYTITFL